MPTVDDLRRQIGSLAPEDGAAGWDPAGLQIGDAAAPVRSIAVCHEVVEDVVSAVESAPVDVLVTYHPLLFHPTRTFTSGAGAVGRAYRLARSGTSLLVVHTAFDTAPGGGADALADLIGLTDRSGFFPAWRQDTVKVVTFVPAAAVTAVSDAMTGAGAGTIRNYTACSYRSEGVGTFVPGPGARAAAGEPGTFNEEAEIRLEMIAPASRRDAVVTALMAAHPYEAPALDVYTVESEPGMVGRIGTLTSHSLRSLAGATSAALHVPVRVAGSASDISRVAVLPGSGGEAVAAAVEAGADVLVTGDVDHHQARRALELGLALIDAGHTPTERPGIKALYDRVAAIGPDTVDLTFIDPYPWEEVAWKS
jgi:dinuclear metal center YbgI/SA1388 family protein